MLALKINKMFENDIYRSKTELAAASHFSCCIRASYNYINYIIIIESAVLIRSLYQHKLDLEEMA